MELLVLQTESNHFIVLHIIFYVAMCALHIIIISDSFEDSLQYYKHTCIVWLVCILAPVVWSGLVCILAPVVWYGLVCKLGMTLLNDIIIDFVNYISRIN